MIYLISSQKLKKRIGIPTKKWQLSNALFAEKNLQRNRVERFGEIEINVKKRKPL